MTNRRTESYEQAKKGINESVDDLLESFASHRDLARELTREAMMVGSHGNGNISQYYDSKFLDKYLEEPCEELGEIVKGSRFRAPDTSAIVAAADRVAAEKEDVKQKLAAGKRVEAKEDKAVGQIKKGVKTAVKSLSGK